MMRSYAGMEVRVPRRLERLTCLLLLFAVVADGSERERRIRSDGGIMEDFIVVDCGSLIRICRY